MKTPLVFLLTISLAMLSCSTNIQSDAVVIKGATIFDGTGSKMENAMLVVKDGRIDYVGLEMDSIPKNAKITDVSGKYIAPGLVDSHIHFFQTGFFDARPDALDIRDSIPYEWVYQYQKENSKKYYETYLRSGVTAVYDVGDFKWTLQMAKEAANDSLAPYIVSAGPLLTPVAADYVQIFNVSDDSVMVHLGSAEIGVDHVKKMTEKGAVGIKIWSVAHNDSLFMDYLNRTSEATKKVANHLIVHATTLKQAKAALRHNTKLLVHSVEDTIIDQEFIDLAKSNGVYYNPTLVVYEGYYNTYKSVLGDTFKIEDPHNVIDERTKSLLQGAEKFKRFYGDTLAGRANLENMNTRMAFRDSIMAINLRKVHKAGIPIVVGTDAGNPGTLHGISIYDEMEAIQKAGIGPMDIITMATKNGAEIIGKATEFGTLEKGKSADLIILEKDPSIDIANMRSIITVMRKGNSIDVDKSF